MDWDDIRYFLAVARTGSTRASAGSLRVNQSTVARRIAAMEESLGIQLFDKQPSGYCLTETGRDLLSQAEAAEESVERFLSDASAAARRIKGTVRLTTTEYFADNLLGGPLAHLRSEYPELKVELITTDAWLDLGGGEADIALRAGARPTDGSLVGRLIASDPMAVYCSRSYAERFGMPSGPDEVGRHALIGFAGEAARSSMKHATDWFQSLAGSGGISLKRNSAAGIMASAKAGLGLAFLPSFIAGRETELIRCFDPLPEHVAEVWLLTHERLRKVPHIRVTLDCLAEFLVKDREGGPPQ